MNPHVEAWRAAKQQQEGQNEGQVAGATLVMINSLCSQIKDQYADTNEELKNVQKVIHEGIHKTFKSGQDQMREVGIEVKTQIGEACQRVGDYIPEFRQVGERIYQNIAPVGDHVAELNKILAAVDFVKIEELPKSIVRLEKRTENVKKDIQNTQATAQKWTKILFTILGVFTACVLAFCVAFFIISASQAKIFKENLELKTANNDLYKKYIDYKDQRDDAVAKHNELADFVKWLAGDELEAYKAKYKASKQK